jgi:3-methylornithyl-N6-L-lysine dehydrogenase
LTRLIAEQVLGIPGNLKEFDRELIKKTGSSLKELAFDAATFSSTTTAAPLAPAACPVAVIPVTAGEGTIKGFSEALCAIAAYLGFPVFITDASDVAGLVEAYQRDATIALMADDHLYAALNLKTRRIAGNDEATAKGYTVALKKMAGGLANKEVLLIGLGPLGTSAAQALLQEGAGLIVYDLVREKEAALLKSCTREEQQRITTGLSLEQSLARTNLIFDASPGGAFIPAALLPADAIISAPGLPLGFEATAAQKFTDRLIHEPLQIGTAVMLFQALI